MDNLKIFHEFSNLKFLKLTIDGYEIIGGDLISIQLDQSFKGCGIVGKIEFKDTFDMFNNDKTVLDNSNVVKVSFRDFSENSYIRTFRITSMSHRKYNERFRIVSISIIDEITHKLSVTHMDGYFKGDVAIGAQNIIESVCGDLLISGNLSISAEGNSESYDGNVLINSSQNCLEFLISKLAKYNLRLFQTRETIYIKELKPSELIPFEHEFTDKTMNNKYMYKVFDREQLNINNMAHPKVENYRIDGKNINTDTKNLDDIKGDLIINKSYISTDNLQAGSVKRQIQSTLTEGQQKMRVFDQYINTNRMALAVVGTIAGGNIDTVISATFNGLVGFTDITKEGDVMNSGNYYVCGVSDLIIGAKYIQRLTVSRVENNKPFRGR